MWPAKLVYGDVRPSGKSEQPEARPLTRWIYLCRTKIWKQFGKSNGWRGSKTRRAWRIFLAQW